LGKDCQKTLGDTFFNRTHRLWVYRAARSPLFPIFSVAFSYSLQISSLSVSVWTSESPDKLIFMHYRVRGVDGSCAKHLTVESYTVVMLLTFILIIISIPSPSLFHSRLKTFLFCKSFPAQPSFSCPGLTTWIPRTVCCYSKYIRFLLFTFWFRAVD